MEMIVLGIDHALQAHDQPLEELVAGLVKRNHVTMIAEENRIFYDTIARRVAESLAVAWVQMDMSTEDRMKAGILNKLSNRMQVRGYDANDLPIQAIRYAPVEDGIREEFWLDRIESATPSGTVLVICGPLHCRPFSEKAARRGHIVSSILFYPEDLSELIPELF
jgi:hypothetical protein